MTRRMSRPPRAATITLAAAAIFMAPSLTACGSNDDGQSVTQAQAYACTDAQDVVVDDDYCDGDTHSSGFYFLHSYYPGTYSNGVAPRGAQLSGGSRISATDANARSNAGLPKAGAVKSGTTVKSGGFGSGVSGRSGSGSGHGGSSGG